MLAVGLLPFIAFGLLALVPMLDTASDDPIAEEDPVPEEDPVVREDPVVGEDPVTNTLTSVSVTDADGIETIVEFDSANAVAGEVDTVDGTALRDVIVAPDEATVPLQIKTLEGDDAVQFGFGTSVDPGEGVDVLDLTITAAALANGNLAGGTVDFADTDDALAIEVEDDATGFLHEIRVTLNEAPDAATASQTEVLIYVLSDAEILTIDDAATATAGELVFDQPAQVLVQVNLGTETTVTGTDAEGNPTTTVTGGINDDPTIVLNRDVTSEQTITV